MKLLSIETSCDETGISIIDANGYFEDNTLNFTVLANTLASQANMHAEYGGVYPALAKREHIKALPLLCERAFFDAKRNASHDNIELDAISVTYGPGLEPALWTGVNFAKDLSKKFDIPIVPVNHMEGHIFSAVIKEHENTPFHFSAHKLKYPSMALLISGGHTELILIEGPFKYKYIGGTLDDAVGEAFDKVARMLGLGYPGGPLISKLAEKARLSGNGYNIKPLPRPMLNSGDFNFSFSGLKTAVLYQIKAFEKEYGKTMPDDIVESIALEFENAVADVLAKKTVSALREFHAESLIIAGGVSANRYVCDTIRRNVHEHINEFFSDVLTPRPDLTGDNALMIAVAGYCRATRGEYAKSVDEINAKGTLKL